MSKKSGPERSTGPRAKASLGQLRTLLDLIPVPAAMVEHRRGGNVCINAALANLLRIPPGTDLSRRGRGAFKPSFTIMRGGQEIGADEFLIPAAATARSTGAGVELDLRFDDGSIVNIVGHTTPLFDAKGRLSGAVSVYLDVTSRKRSEETLQFLLDAAAALSTSLDPEETLRGIALLVVPRMADWCSVDILGEDGKIRSLAVTHVDPEKVKLAQEFSRRYPPVGTRGAPHVIQTGRAELYPDIPDALLVEGAKESGYGEEYLGMLRGLGVRSAMVVPMLARERAVGAITFIAAESGRRYTKADLAFAHVLTTRCGLAYENARLYEREHRIASTLQRAFLPESFPQLPGVKLNGTYLPGALEAEVGGDWYDAFSLFDGSIGISVGDVAGHGLEAAVTMGAVRQAVRVAALEGHPPSAVLWRANRVLSLEADAGMVTAIFGIVDPVARTFTYATAGHPPPFLARPGGDVMELEFGGLPLGVDGAEATWQEWSVPLPPGSLLTLYTDGLTEHTRDVIEGEKALKDAIRKEAASPSTDPARSIQERAVAGRPTDDIAILTVVMGTAASDKFDVTLPAQAGSARLVRQAIRAFARNAGLSEERTFDLQVAVGEAVNNVIEHAYKAGTGTVRVLAHREGDALLAEVKDNGTWRPIREEGRGRGLPLMQGLMDRVDIQSSEISTTVHLTMFGAFKQ